MAAGQKLLYLDLPAVLDYSTVDAVSRLKNSADAEHIRAFEKEAAPAGKGFSLGRLLSVFSGKAEPEAKLLPGAKPFVDEISAMARRNGRVYLHSVDATPVMVHGQEYKPKIFNPFIAAFRDAAGNNGFKADGLAPIGLGAEDRSQKEIDDALKLRSFDDSIERGSVMVITADHNTAAKAQELGYKTVVVKSGDYDAPLKQTRAFLAAAP